MTDYYLKVLKKYKGHAYINMYQHDLDALKIVCKNINERKVT